jgi:hypothetical protein
MTKGPTGLGGPILVAGCKDSFAYVSTWRCTLAVTSQRLRGLADMSNNPEEKAAVFKECVDVILKGLAFAAARFSPPRTAAFCLRSSQRFSQFHLSDHLN